MTSRGFYALLTAYWAALLQVWVYLFQLIVCSSWLHTIGCTPSLPTMPQGRVKVWVTRQLDASWHLGERDNADCMEHGFVHRGLNVHKYTQYMHISIHICCNTHIIDICDIIPVVMVIFLCLFQVAGLYYKTWSYREDALLAVYKKLSDHPPPSGKRLERDKRCSLPGPDDPSK